MTFDLLGFPVTIQNGLFVLAGIYLLMGVQNREPMQEVAAGVVVIFASILWHELGHAFAARRLKLGPIDITLHGFGGYTRHSVADRPWKNLVVSLAGPMNGLAVGLIAIPAYLRVDHGLAASVLGEFVFVNVFWSLFNLLPMVPLDGGNALFSGLRIVAPSVAIPAVIASSALFGGSILAFGILMAVQGVSAALFLIWIAGTVLNRAWGLWGAWRQGVARANDLG